MAALLAPCLLVLPLLAAASERCLRAAQTVPPDDAIVLITLEPLPSPFLPWVSIPTQSSATTGIASRVDWRPPAPRPPPPDAPPPPPDLGSLREALQRRHIEEVQKRELASAQVPLPVPVTGVIERGASAVNVQEAAAPEAPQRHHAPERHLRDAVVGRQADWEHHAQEEYLGVQRLIDEPSKEIEDGMTIGNIPLKVKAEQNLKVELKKLEEEEDLEARRQVERQERLEQVRRQREQQEHLEQTRKQKEHQEQFEWTLEQRQRKERLEQMRWQKEQQERIARDQRELQEQADHIWKEREAQKEEVQQRPKPLVELGNRLKKQQEGKWLQQPKETPQETEEVHKQTKRKLEPGQARKTEQVERHGEHEVYQQREEARRRKDREEMRAEGETRSKVEEQHTQKEAEDRIKAEGGRGRADRRRAGEDAQSGARALQGDAQRQRPGAVAGALGHATEQAMHKVDERRFQKEAEDKIKVEDAWASRRQAELDKERGHRQHEEDQQHGQRDQEQEQEQAGGQKEPQGQLERTRMERLRQQPLEGRHDQLHRQKQQEQEQQLEQVHKRIEKVAKSEESRVQEEAENNPQEITRAWQRDQQQQQLQQQQEVQENRQTKEQQRPQEGVQHRQTEAGQKQNQAEKSEKQRLQDEAKQMKPLGQEQNDWETGEKTHTGELEAKAKMGMQAHSPEQIEEGLKHREKLYKRRDETEETAMAVGRSTPLPPYVTRTQTSTQETLLHPVVIPTGSAWATMRVERQQASLDCVLSAWSAWSDCGRLRGDGMRSRYSTRTRQVLQPPREGGRLCPPDMVSARACLTKGNLEKVRTYADMFYYPFNKVEGWLD